MSKIENLYVVNMTGYTDRIPNRVEDDTYSEEDVDNLEYIFCDNFQIRNSDGTFKKLGLKAWKSDNGDLVKSEWKDIHDALVKVYTPLNIDSYVVTRGSIKFDPNEYCYGNICDTDVIKTDNGLIVLVVHWDTESG